MAATMCLDLFEAPAVERPGTVEIDPETRYRRLRRQALARSRRLLRPGAPLAELELHRRGMAELRRLGDELRPISLRSRDEELRGEELTREVLELFAA